VPLHRVGIIQSSPKHGADVILHHDLVGAKAEARIAVIEFAVLDLLAERSWVPEMK
jgi:hypothetical protein